MTILALDTTSELASVALRAEGKAVAELAIESDEGFAHLIIPAIKRLLEQTRVRLDAIDCFAAASGPGSFTGVRVGLSAIKGLAEGQGKAAAGVSNLQALATFGTRPLRAVILDARRGEVYAAVYDANLEPVLPEVATALPQWLEMLEAPEYEFICSSPLALAQTRFAQMPFLQAPRTLAAAIAYCAEQSPAQDPAQIDANYVRRSDAELFWRDK